MLLQINHRENCKMRIRRFDSAFDKHEIVKLLIMILSKRKYKDVGVYSEFPMPNGDIPDVVIDFGDNLILYEVQKEVSTQWIERIKNRDFELPLKILKNVDTQIINLNELSDNLPELIKQLEDRLI